MVSLDFVQRVIPQTAAMGVVIAIKAKTVLLVLKIAVAPVVKAVAMEFVKP